MITLTELYNILDKYAPFSYSEDYKKIGDFDNSGIIINNHNDVKKILFSLDLNKQTILYAKKLKCDTIITHHPAIFYPIQKIDNNISNNNVLLAYKENFNIISLHLNLDVAKYGIDFYLAKALGAEKQNIVEALHENVGYGRIFKSTFSTLKEFKLNAEKVLKSKKIIVYGNLNSKISNVASFCGAGAKYAMNALMNGKIKDEIIVSSDIRHETLKDFIDNGNNVVNIPHYVSENYGFNKFYAEILKQLDGKIEVYYFEDKRFM